MPEMNLDYLEELEQYFASGDLAFDFEYAPEAKRLEMLDFMEKLMELGELADQVATKLIFKDSLLEMITGGKPTTE